MEGDRYLPFVTQVVWPIFDGEEALVRAGCRGVEPLALGEGDERIGPQKFIQLHIIIFGLRCVATVLSPATKDSTPIILVFRVESMSERLSGQSRRDDLVQPGASQGISCVP